MKFEKYLTEGKFLAKDYQALGLKPVQAGDKREADIKKAIQALAKKFKVGPIEDHKLRIDPRGDIMMLQKMKGSVDYVQDEGLPEKLKKIAQKYNKNYAGEVTGRWIKLNHFTWEKMLRDLGY